MTYPCSLQGSASVTGPSGAGAGTTLHDARPAQSQPEKTERGGLRKLRANGGIVARFDQQASGQPDRAFGSDREVDRSDQFPYAADIIHAESRRPEADGAARHAGHEKIDGVQRKACERGVEVIARVVRKFICADA